MQSTYLVLPSFLQSKARSPEWGEASSRVLVQHVGTHTLLCNAQVVERVRRKAAIFGQDITDSDDGQASSFKVEPSTVAQLYEKWIMPLTKQVQVAYLLRRLDS